MCNPSLDSPGKNTHPWSIISDSSWKTKITNQTNRRETEFKTRSTDTVHIHNNASSSSWSSTTVKFVCVCEADCLVCLSSHCAVKDLTRRSRSCCCNNNTTFHHFINPSQNNPVGRKTRSERESCVRKKGGVFISFLWLFHLFLVYNLLLFVLSHLCLTSYNSVIIGSVDEPLHCFSLSVLSS